MIYDATKHDDLRRLADDIRSVPEQNRAAFAACISALGLMKGPIFWRVSARLVQLRHRCSLEGAYLRLYTAPHREAPKVVEAVIEHTAHHARFGTDREDNDSVGGFSQREIDALAQLLGIMH